MAQQPASNQPVLVTSVPLVHLEADNGRSHVAFGSRLLEVLEAFDAEAGVGAPVFIHGSRNQSSEHPPETVEWVATWVGWEPAVGNGIPSRKTQRLRPPTAAAESGYFYAFYIVTDLTRLDAPLPVRAFTSWSTDTAFQASFIPRGPVIARYAP